MKTINIQLLVNVMALVFLVLATLICALKQICHWYWYSDSNKLKRLVFELRGARRVYRFGKWKWIWLICVIYLLAYRWS